MQSLNLMPELLKLPAGPTDSPQSSRDRLTALVGADRAVYAAEISSASSAGLWTVFDEANVDDNLRAAYEAQYPNLAADHSLCEYWQSMMDRGEGSMQGFINGIKGKLAEFNAAEQLRDAGHTNVTIAENPTQAVFDITAIPPGGGAEVSWQVKTGGADYAGEVLDAMQRSPDVHFAVSSEIHDQISESAPEMAERMLELDADLELVNGIQDGLETLSNNLGVDVPDSLAEIIPYGVAIAASARLLYGVIRTEQEFQAADRTTKNKIQVVQTLTLMSRMGISSVLAYAGGMGGTAAGSVIPGIGNLAGGIAGSLAGAGMGMYLNRHLQPRMLSLALSITGLEQDDLFYFKNKPRIDLLALSFQRTAASLNIAANAAD